jgi:hypothetical protein
MTTSQKLSWGHGHDLLWRATNDHILQAPVLELKLDQCRHFQQVYALRQGKQIKNVQSPEIRVSSQASPSHHLRLYLIFQNYL